MTLSELLQRPGLHAGEVRGYLDGLDAVQRIDKCLTLSRDLQKRLWEIASRDPGPSGELLVAGSAAATHYAGRNSLLFFNHFEKRFREVDSRIVGYNHHALRWLIGPGYFTVRPGESGRLVFDYSQVPLSSPAGWPAVTPNSRPLARPVYGDLIDEVVWVTKEVLVGAAFRAGALLDSYFVLTLKGSQPIAPS